MGLFAVFAERNMGVISVEELVYILKDLNLAFSQAEYEQLASYFARMGKVSLPRVLRFGKSMKDKSIVLITVICFMLYPTISRKIFQSFSCLGGLKDGAADSYLNHDLEVACTDIGHIVYIIMVALPALLIYVVGFPVTSLLCVRKDRQTARHRREQQQKSHDRETETPDNTAYRFSILLQGYHDRCWYWESIVMLRKATLILIAAFFGNFGPELQFFFASFTLVLAMVAKIYVKPYKEDILNKVETAGLMTMFVSLYIGIFFFWRLLNEQTLFVLGVLVIVINATFAAYALGAIVRNYLQRTTLGRILYRKRNGSAARFRCSMEDLLDSDSAFVLILSIMPLLFLLIFAWTLDKLGIGLVLHKRETTRTTPTTASPATTITSNMLKQSSSPAEMDMTADFAAGEQETVGIETAADGTSPEDSSALLIPGAATQATTAFDAESIAQRKLKERRLSLTVEKEKEKEQQQLLDHVAMLEEKANEEAVFML